MNDTQPVAAPPAVDKNPLDSVYATRRANLQLLVNEHGNSALAALLGYSNGSYISQLLAEGRTFTEVTARSIETKRGLPVGWMDVPRGV